MQCHCTFFSRANKTIPFLIYLNKNITNTKKFLTLNQFICNSNKHYSNHNIYKSFSYSNNNSSINDKSKINDNNKNMEPLQTNQFECICNEENYYDSKNNNYCFKCKGNYNLLEEKNLKLPNIATDAIVIKCHENEKELNKKYEILLINRKKEPYKNKLAFPGGFLDYNESPEKGCLRELKEETSLIGNKSKLFTMISNPKRDPRKHIVSFIYSIEVSEEQVPKADDDALDAQFYNLFDVFKSGKEEFAFDHFDILSDYIKNELKLNI